MHVKELSHQAIKMRFAVLLTLAAAASGLLIAAPHVAHARVVPSAPRGLVALRAPVEPVAKAAITASPVKGLGIFAEVFTAIFARMLAARAVFASFISSLLAEKAAPTVTTIDFQFDWAKGRLLRNVRSFFQRTEDADVDYEFVWRAE